MCKYWKFVTNMHEHVKLMFNQRRHSHHLLLKHEKCNIQPHQFVSSKLGGRFIYHHRSQNSPFRSPVPAA